MDKVNKIFYSIVILVGITIIGVIYFVNQNKEYKVINNIIDRVTSSSNNEVIYISSSNCDECDLQTYQFKLLVDDYNFKYYYINLDKISNFKRKKIFKKIGLENNNFIPTVAIFKDGKLDSSLTGVTGINRLYRLLKDYGFLNDKKLPLNYLNITNYASKLEEEKVILALGSYVVSESNQFEQVLWDINNTYDIDINFLYLADLSESDGKLFEQKIANINEFDMDIPALLIIENGSIKNAIFGLKESEEYVEFLTENDII